MFFEENNKMQSGVTQRKQHRMIVAGLLLVLGFTMPVHGQKATASFVSAYGYDSCVLLKNRSVSVLLEPNAGGRVISYAFNGVNVLYEDSLQNGWTSKPSMPRSKGHLAGGRFDIGPSRTKPNTDLFFFGKWKASITGNASARLISQTDSLSEVYLIRDFKLDEHSSKLTCTQTIVNKGNKPFSASYWARTFATGNGICIMPVPDNGRFPNKYIMFMNRDTINMLPRDSNILLKDGCLIIKGPPQKPKLEMDVAKPAWIAYAATSNLLFIKKFSVFTEKYYGDVTAANTSVWYNGTQMVEIEPIGPLETIKPGGTAFFKEEWYLHPFSFPANRNVEIEQVKHIVKTVK